MSRRELLASNSPLNNTGTSLTSNDNSHNAPDLALCRSCCEAADLRKEVLSRQLFFDQVAEAWEEEHRESALDSKMARLLERLELKPGQVVLDAGCGTGRLVPLISEKIGPEGKLIAVDVSANMLKIARQKFNFHNVVFIQADVCELDASKLFDRVICLSLFPHLPDQESGLRAFKKYLKPNGQLIIAHTASREEVNSYHAQLPEPICYDQLPERNQMINLLQKTGFKLLELEESDVYFLRATPA
ncbi:MAG: methyltransferase domain-containing protein [Candidatus Aminicenantes bacterium]|nr:methyltransferase domain-containing protein [Candidatus Aminicenantes bacterium]